MFYVTSDLHINDTREHKLRGTKRFWADCTNWADLIRDRWNAVVNKDDTVYIIGDVDRNNGDVSYIQNLNGNKILIKGNHDDADNKIYERYFREIYEDFHILEDVFSIPVYMTHKPENYKPGMFNLVGHVHDTWKHKRDMINVGLDAWGMTPLSEADIEYAIEVNQKYLDNNDLLNEVDPNEIRKADEKLKLENYAYLGGVCTRGYLNWRFQLIGLIDCEYCNPHILDVNITEKIIDELAEKKKHARVEVFYIDNSMDEISTIADAVNTCYQKGKRVIFAYNTSEMGNVLVASLDVTAEMLKSINKKVEIVKSGDKSICLDEVSKILKKELK